jgi:peroxiredoxin
MKNMLKFSAALGLASLVFSANTNRLWDAVVNVSGVEIPFRFELSSTDKSVSGTFFDGNLKLTSTKGTLAKGDLHLRWDYLDSNLDGKIDSQGRFQGIYTTYKGSPMPLERPVRAQPFVPVRVSAEAKVPSVAGQWEVRAIDANQVAKPGPDKNTWKLFIRQSGVELSGAILRLSGDTGTIDGKLRGRHLVLSNFAGARPTLLEGNLNDKGELELTLNGHLKLIGLRSGDARAKGLPEPADPTRYTSVKDPSQPFRFSFPDASGKLVANTDERFRGKVVIVDISGTWCANCQDEAPLLVSLFNKYHDQGLEIVQLSFETGDTAYDWSRIDAFAKRHKISYPILLAGNADQVQEKLPFIVNFGAFPTTFFLGRDGRVHSVHDGFASQATGEVHTQLVRETTALVQQLLAQPKPVLRT